MDEPVAQLAVNQNEGIGLVREVVTEDEYGFFFKKDNPLAAQFSEVIESLEANGTLDALKTKWCGADDSVKTIPEQDWETPNGTLKMTTTGQQEPLTYVSGNKVVGYDIEVALLVCKELGYGLTVEAADFSATLAAVPSGKADFGGGGVSITEERKKTVDFTTPDYHGALVMVVRALGDVATPVGGFLEGLSSSFRKTFVEEDRWQLIVGGLGVTVAISVSARALGRLAARMDATNRPREVEGITHSGA